MLLAKTKIVCAGLVLGLATTMLASACFGQGAQSADQSAFRDDGDLLQLENGQIRALEGEEMSAQNQADLDDRRNSAYRLYAQKRVDELEKLKGKDSQSQIQVLQNWLRADSMMRMRDMQTIRTLRQRVATLEQSQQSAMSNLGNDVSSIREDAIDARSDDKFKQQMQMNYFNEMQTEMGPASWYEHPQNGVSYSMGGMGFNGGQSLLGGY